MNPHFKTVWTHIRRSPYQALVAVVTMMLTFFLCTVVVLFTFTSHGLLRYLETRPQVTAFFKDETEMEDIQNLKEKLIQTGKIKELKYVSKGEALEIYKEQNKKDPLLLEMVTANILPASLEVSAKDITFLEELATILRQDTNVEEVVFQEDVVKTLKNWTDNIRKGGIALIIFLGIVSLLVVLIIIGMKVALRKEEIEILQLIGATNGYIRIPFVLEGIFYGFLGAILGWGGGFLLLLYSTPFLVEFFSGIPLLPIPLVFMLKVLGGEILGGVLMGSVGSLLAVKKYLK